MSLENRLRNFGISWVEIHPRFDFRCPEGHFSGQYQRHATALAQTNHIILTCTQNNIIGCNTGTYKIRIMVQVLKLVIMILLSLIITFFIFLDLYHHFIDNMTYFWFVFTEIHSNFMLLTSLSTHFDQVFSVKIFF